jgi:hypothetical protein
MPQIPPVIVGSGRYQTEGATAPRALHVHSNLTASQMPFVADDHNPTR